ncbi:hypothetical protein BOTBODRAFT_114251 [Botryobasidium botryosum FD-172 SS1]|uniref:Serine/threonine-protein phosphatase n=1 Tax=Botryobasidium botryosum (strain FD-172 SS1) TaxID=930990 RepID=A0A067M723_BOTB1|nr:hypothetical protein BOTBODRAFT_114251 [Botryobasidium botryosum FD-172 SS1]
MGQTPSKKSKKVKDSVSSPTAVAASDPLPSAANAAQDPAAAGSLSKATGNGKLRNGRDPSPSAPRGSPPPPTSSDYPPSPASTASFVPVAESVNAASPTAAPTTPYAPAPPENGTPSSPYDSSTTPTILSNPNANPAALSNSDKSRTFDIDDMISRLLEVGYSGKASKAVCLKNNEITAICQAAREVFLSQPTLIELSPPVKIVGDVHGQYSDLIRLFEMCGFPPSSNYLFLGDYVDRGKQSLETILLLLCYKVKFPENFFLLRGNHECANVTRVYGFYDECKRRCNIKIWKTFIDVFNCLPIAAVVASKIFCVHGGLSPSMHSMEDIKRINRPTDVPDFGLLNDLLWSDPSDTATEWEDNERGVSYCFGKSIINEFLGRYDMDLICRAHMVVEDGYEFWNDRTLVTVFSAPNYCGEFDNYGACMSVSEDLLCAFELLKPLDGPALRKEMTKARRKR